jgi:hypothetical protein
MHGLGHVRTRLGRRFAQRSAAGAALVAVLIALVVGFMGSSTAAVLIGSRQIKDGSIRSVDVHNGTVRGVDVRDHSVTAADVLGGVLQGPQGPDGTVPGDPGPPGSAALQYAIEARTIVKDQILVWDVPCQAGLTAIGGGVSTTNPGLGRMVRSTPDPDGTGWQVGIAHDSGVDEDISAFGWAVCVNHS